jgi:hypothetical protein
MSAISTRRATFPKRNLTKYLGLATAVILGVGLLNGLAVSAAQATPTASLVVRLLSPTGKVVKDGDVVAFPMTNGSYDASRPIVDLPPVAHHPGTYAADGFVAGDTETLVLFGSPSSSLAAQFLGGGQDPDSATILTLTAGANSLDASFAPSGTISGTVKNAKGKAIANVCVEPYQFDGKNWNSIDGSFFGCGAWTNSKGKYSFNPGSAGSYKLEFFDQTGKYLPQFSNGAADVADATSIYLNDGKSATVNTILSLGGRISGKLVAPGGVPLDLQVDAYQLTGNPTDGFTASSRVGIYTESNSHGSFTLTGLPTGYYALGYEDPFDGSGAGFIGGDHPTDATPFLVTAPATTAIGTTTIGAAATVTGTLGVTLTGPSGVPLQNEDGSVWLTTSDGADYYPASSTGNVYHFTQLPAGDYHLVADIVGDFGPLFEPVVQAITTHATNETRSLQVGTYAPVAFTSDASLSTLSPIAGSQLSVDPGTVSKTAPNSTTGYQWFRTVNGVRLPIRGAKSATYTPTTGDVGDILSVRVTQIYELDADREYISQEETDQLVAASDAVATGPQITSSGQPQLTTEGAARVGSPIGVDPGNWSVAGAHYAYEWFRGTDPIIGQTGSTYTPVPSDLGDSISVQVTASKVGFVTSDAAASGPVTIGKGILTAITLPRVMVTKSHGIRHFAVTSGTWSAPDSTVSYQWNLDGNLAGTGKTFTYSGKSAAVTAVVTAASDGYADSWQTVIAAKGVFAAGANCSLQTQSPLLFQVNLSVGVLCQSLNLPSGSGEIVVATNWQRLVHGKWVTISHSKSGAYTTVAADMGRTIRIGMGVHSDYYTSPVNYEETTFTGRTDLQGNATATISPSQVALGDVASVHVTGLPVPGITHSYQWQYQHNGGAWTTISGATKSSLSVKSPVSTGDQLRVEVTSIAPGFISATIDSSAVSVVVKTVTNLTPPTVSPDGVPAGGTATAKPGTWNAKSLTFTYQWQLDGTDIPSATARTLITDLAQVGHQLTVTVVGHRSGYLDSDAVTSAPVDVLAAIQPPLTPAGASLTGVKYLSTATTPDPNTAFGFPSTFHSFTTTYKWTLSGKTLAGITGPTYVPKSSDIGKSLSVTMSYSSAFYQSGSETSPKYTVQKADPVQLDAQLEPSSGSYAPGTVLTAFTDSTSGSPVTVRWQSSLDESTWTNISHTTKSTYTLAPADAGKWIRAVVTSHTKNHLDSIVTTGDVSVDYLGALTALSAPTISAPQVGVATTINSGLWSAGGVTVAYQWMLDGQAIPGASSATFTPTGTLVTQDLSVEISASKVGWSGHPVVESNADAIAFGAVLTVVTKPVITGSAKTCSTLTVTPGKWKVGGTVVTYQWFADANPIGGATGSTLTIPSNAAGVKFHVELTANAHGYLQGVYDTASTAATTAAATCH